MQIWWYDYWYKNNMQKQNVKSYKYDDKFMITRKIRLFMYIITNIYISLSYNI